MTPAELARHKAAPERLAATLAFNPMKRGKWPKPFHKMGGSRVRATELTAVSEIHRVLFVWRDGELKTDSLFLAWLFCELDEEPLYPLFKMHVHPSHKGLHAKLPCKTDINDGGRQLVKAPELTLSSVDGLDPRSEADRQQLIGRFCQACGITMGEGGGLWN